MHIVISNRSNSAIPGLHLSIEIWTKLHPGAPRSSSSRKRAKLVSKNNMSVGSVSILRARHGSSVSQGPFNGWSQDVYPQALGIYTVVVGTSLKFGHSLDESCICSKELIGFPNRINRMEVRMEVYTTIYNIQFFLQTSAN